jgi:hypothetical protein
MSLTIFGEIADSFDARVEEAIRELDWWVDQYRRDDDSMVDYYAAAAVSSVTQSFMQFASGFVDVLRLGEGVQEGSWSGLGEDALRLLVVAGPAVRYTLGGTRLLRVLAVESQIGYQTTCTWISTTRAAREAGHLFVTIDELARAVGLSRLVNALRTGRASGTSIGQIYQIHRVLTNTLRIRSIEHSITSYDDLWRLVESSPRNTFVFGIRGHGMYATARRGAVSLIDTDGRVFRSISQLLEHYPGAVFNESRPVLEVYHSLIVVVEEAAAVAGNTGAGAHLALQSLIVPNLERNQLPSRRDGGADGTQGRRVPARNRRPL